MTTVVVRNGNVKVIWEVTEDQWAQIDNAINGRNRKKIVAQETKDVVTFIRESIRLSKVQIFPSFATLWITGEPLSKALDLSTQAGVSPIFCVVTK